METPKTGKSANPQMSLPLSSQALQGLRPEQRHEAIAHLACLLLEAIGCEEGHDDET